MPTTIRTLSGTETIRALRISRRTLKRLLADGVLEGWQLGRILRVRLDSVEALLRSYRKRGTAERL
jgi:excisionase family DNA binding protein